MSENNNNSESEEKLITPELEHLSKAIKKQGLKVTFGLQPNHIERIESELERWDSYIKPEDKYLCEGYMKYEMDFWNKLGKEFGWMGFALALYYFEYLDKKQNSGNICKICNEEIAEGCLPKVYCPECGNDW